MILKKYQFYLYFQFIKKFIYTSIIFFCLVIIVNFFEEVRFSENIMQKYIIPFTYLYLTLLH